MRRTAEQCRWVEKEEIIVAMDAAHTSAGVGFAKCALGGSAAEMQCGSCAAVFHCNHHSRLRTNKHFAISVGSPAAGNNGDDTNTRRPPTSSAVYILKHVTSLLTLLVRVPVGVHELLPPSAHSAHSTDGNTMYSARTHEPSLPPCHALANLALLSSASK